MLQKKNSNYIRLYQKTTFGFKFGLREGPNQKTDENMHLHFHAFSGRGTS